MIEFSNITFLKGNFKDIQNKLVDYNSDRLSNLTCILAGKLQLFLVNRLLNYKAVFNGDSNEKIKNLTTRVGIFRNMGGYSRWEFFGREFSRGIFQGEVWWLGIFRENLCRGSLMGGNSLGGNFLGGSFPDIFTKYDNY